MGHCFATMISDTMTAGTGHEKRSKAKRWVIKKSTSHGLLEQNGLQKVETTKTSEKGNQLEAEATKVAAVCCQALHLRN